MQHKEEEDRNEQLSLDIPSMKKNPSITYVPKRRMIMKQQLEGIVEERETPYLKTRQKDSPFILQAQSDEDDDDTPTLKQKVESKRRLEYGKTERK